MKTWIVALALFVSQTSLLLGVPTYQLIHINLKNCTSSKANCINDRGTISGTYVEGKTSYIFAMNAKQKFTTREEKFLSHKVIVNNQDELFGSIVRRASDRYWEFNEESIFQWKNPFNYFQIFNFDNLGYPPLRFSTANGFKDNVAWDANDLGQILVMNKRTINEAIEIAPKEKTGIWVYEKGDYHKVAHPQFEAGFKINNHSQILGYYHTGNAKDYVDHVSVYDFNNKTVRLIHFPLSAYGYDINDKGQVVGEYYQEETDEWHGFLAEPTGEIIYIPNFLPKAINNVGQIVGSYQGEKNGQLALWENGILHDLKKLTTLKDDQGHIWDSLDRLVDINEDGWIIGNGILEEKQQAFLLKPKL